jgi:uncharacterized protein
MKKILLTLIVLLTLSTNAGANTFCYSTGNPDLCFQTQINSFVRVYTKFLKELYSSHKFTASEKRDLENEQRDWENRVNSQCSNSECVANSAETRAYHIAKIVDMVRARK